jgi:hypothetical protein
MCWNICCRGWLGVHSILERKREFIVKTIVIVIDNGLALAYFLYTDLAKKLLDKNVRLVFLVQDELLPKLRQDYEGTPNLVFESLREDQLARYQKTYRPRLQELLEYIRGASASPRIPLTYVDTHRKRKITEASGRWKLVLQLSQPIISLLRSSKAARKLFQRFQNWSLTPAIYEDYLDRYAPNLVMASTCGWRSDRYMLREANRRHIPTAVVTVGWDNPSANGMTGAYVDYVTVWSKIHAWELSAGIDWPPERIHIGGMPLYDNYLSQKWTLPRQEYFKTHDLDPRKKLLVFVATALSITPNLHIIEALAKLVANGKMKQPSQLLVRLHPNHFRKVARYEEEREAIYELAKKYPDVHVVAPRPMAGTVLRYSGDDFEEKASMLSHADVIISIYSTMVLEAALHDKPVVSACIDTPAGWPDNFWIPLSEIPGWPTARRVNDCNAARTAYTEDELEKLLNDYLENPSLDAEGRHKFIQQELTFLKEGQATEETARYLLSLLGLS